MARSRETSTWVAMDDTLDDHPKIRPLSNAAYRAWHRMVRYSHHYNLDGEVPADVWKGCPKNVRDELTATQKGQRSPLVYAHPDNDGATLHDYLDWQRSAADVEAAKESAAKGGSLGNHRRWHMRRNVIDPACRYCRPNRQTDQGTDRPTDRVGESLGRSGTDQ